MSSRAALHLLLDQIPDGALVQVHEVLVILAANDQLTAEDEAALEAGLASAQAGRVIPAEAVYAQLDAMLAAKRPTQRGA